MPLKKTALRKIILFLGLALSYHLDAQQNPIDSVITIFDQLSEDERANFLINIKYDDLVANTGRFIPLLEKQVNLFKTGQNILTQAQILEQLSLAYYIAGKYDKNFEAGFQALSIYDSLKIPEKSGKMYGELGYRTKRFDLHKAFSF